MQNEKKKKYLCLKVLTHDCVVHETDKTDLFFFVKDRNSFHRVDTVCNIFTSGFATRENITDGVHEKNIYSVYFMLLTLSGRSLIKIQYSSFSLLPVAYPFRIAMYYNITSSARNVR